MLQAVSLQCTMNPPKTTPLAGSGRYCANKTCLVCFRYILPSVASLVQVMAWRRTGDQPFLEAMMTYCQLDLKKHIRIKLYVSYRKMNLKKIPPPPTHTSSTNSWICVKLLCLAICRLYHNISNAPDVLARCVGDSCQVCYSVVKCPCLHLYWLVQLLQVNKHTLQRHCFSIFHSNIPWKNL